MAQTDRTGWIRFSLELNYVWFLVQGSGDIVGGALRSHIWHSDTLSVLLLPTFSHNTSQANSSPVESPTIESLVPQESCSVFQRNLTHSHLLRKTCEGISLLGWTGTTAEHTEETCGT